MLVLPATDSYEVDVALEPAVVEAALMPPFPKRAEPTLGLVFAIRA